MKKILLLLASCFVLVSPSIVKSQTFTVTADTVSCTINGFNTCHNDITNTTSGPITIKWHVTGTDFPADWLVDTVFGICDANLCRSNASSVLWNGTSGSAFYCNYNIGSSAVRTFDLSLNLTSVTPGCHYVNVQLEDSTNSYTKNIRFNVCKVPVKVATVSNKVDDVLIYPNPATDELNVVYDATADIKNIAVYNIIGKMMAIYKVNGPSANLNLQNIPSGIYFVQLVNSRGNVVVTRKFTKQQ